MVPEDFNRKISSKDKRGRRHLDNNRDNRHGSLKGNIKSSESSN